MAVGAVVRARVDERVKEEAASVLAAAGLTTSDAFRMMLVRIARERKLPFEPLAPTEETIAAIREARSATLPRFTDTDDLMDFLKADD